MENKFDVIVVGLGAHGSATVYELSKTKYSVLGIDRFTPPHTHGSSHGESRIIRQAYHEHPMYVPLIREAYTLWHELEKITGKKLLLNTGGLILGRKDADIVQGAIASAKRYDLPYELLSSREIVKRFPAFKPADDTIGVLDATAGILFPEKCIEAFLSEASKNGANLSYNARVLRIDPHADEIQVVTEQNVYLTRKLIISAGAWLDSLMPDLHLPLIVDRQVLHWFKDESESGVFSPARFPIYIWEYSDLGKAFYGFPDLGTGIKAAFHYGGSPIDPDKRSNTVSAEEISDMSDTLQNHLNMNPQHHYSTVCMYTNTPDQHFILDHHPSNPNIIIASPGSVVGSGNAYSRLSTYSGMLIGKHLGNRFYLKSGLTYTSIREKFKEDSLTLSKSNRYKALDLPLIGGYTLISRKLKINLQAGLLFNFYSWRKDFARREIYKKSGLRAQASINLLYPLGEKFQLMVEPYYIRQLSNMTNASSFDLSMQQLGLSMGVHYVIPSRQHH